MSKRGIRVAVIAVDLLEAVSAIVGGIGLLVGFMNIPISVLHGGPFSDFTVPGLLLAVVVGGSALVAACVTAFRTTRLGAIASAAAGCVTVGWITTEVAMIGLGSWLQVTYFAVGVVMIALAALLWRAESVSGLKPSELRQGLDPGAVQ